MLTKAQLDKFEADGFLVLDDFVSLEKCEAMRNECQKIVESPEIAAEIDQIPVFSSKDEESQAADMYFLTSTDKIRPFLEANAVNIIRDAKINQKEGEAKTLPKNIFNKIGHALHALNPVFHDVTFDTNTKDVIKSLGFKKPIVCQSMYIFKQPFIGGEVSIHQDASYLHVEPLREAGIWIALEDCTLENGCLNFIPGSHKGPLARRFIRNPNKEEFDKGKFLIYTNDLPAYDEKDFVAVPIKTGQAILINGLVVHRSAKNFSPKSRHIYTFHVYDSDNATFSKENWMQYSATSFLPLYEQHNVM